MSRVIRVGVIGCGGISNVHIKGIINSPDMEIGAICDILPEKLSEKSNLYGIQKELWFTDYNAMMESGRVDAVSICTPNDVHFQVAMAAIEHNLPYAVEKPVCNSEGEVARLAEETARRNLPNMVCFSYRFKSAARYAREIIQSGQLGAIYHINGEYLQSWGLPGFQDGQDVPLVWRFIRERTGSGALGDLGCHLIDLFRFITGREFERVTADTDTFVQRRRLIDNENKMGIVDVDDYINIIGQMEQKLAAQMRITRFAYGCGNYQRIEVYGDKGALRYELENITGDTLEVNMGNLPMKQGHIWSKVPIPSWYTADQMQAFADIINGKGDGLAANIQDGLVNQRIVDHLIISAESGRRVELKKS